METGILLIKIEIAHFTLVLTVLNRLFELYYEIVTLKVTEDEKVFRLLTSFRYVWDMSLKLKNHTSRHCCRNSSEKLQQNFIIIGMRSYFLKKQLQMQSTETSFGILYVYEVIIKCYPYFITCLYFPLALIR